MATTVDGTSSPVGISSLLDTDLYKLTMQRAVLDHFPRTPVRYRFTNRTPHMRLNRRAFNWLHEQVERLADVVITDQELQWLEKTCPYLGHDYLHFLKHFRFKPKDQVQLLFHPAGDEAGDHVFGHLDVNIQGLWIDTILYEIPLLALISDAYFKFVDTDWTHDGQVENAKQKALKLIENGCAFSEFGSRRRRDYKAHCLVMEGLLDAQREADATHPRCTGKLSGTSNVHMAMKFGVAPVGTVAHEWYMAIAAITDSYGEANEKALHYWTRTFGPGVLAIALTDTFGTPAFLRSFVKRAPASGTTAPELEGRESRYADVYTGVRQDSGDPLEYIQTIKTFYQHLGIEDKKAIVFSDSLNVERCLQYREACEAAGLAPSFGVGTFFTNDFRVKSDPGKKSVPLNIVIKLSEADGRPAVKLSDDVGKNTGESALVERIKEEVGYEEKRWLGGNEAHRWDR